MSLYFEIKTLEDEIALTEYDLSNYQREWDSLLVCYNEITGKPYSVYCEQEELEELEAAINSCHSDLRRDRGKLNMLRVRLQKQQEVNKKADEELMKMCEEYCIKRDEEVKNETNVEGL